MQRLVRCLTGHQSSIQSVGAVSVLQWHLSFLVCLCSPNPFPWHLYAHDVLIDTLWWLRFRHVFHCLLTPLPAAVELHPLANP